MGVWFEGSVDIGCDLDTVRDAVGDRGDWFVGVVSAMPGLSTVELLDQDETSVTIRTSEGTMRRSGIACEVQADRVLLEFDEVYDAGRVTGRSHFRDEFTAADGRVRYHTTVSDVRANGLLGFLYRRFGSRSMGRAFLSAHKTFLEGRRQA